VVDTAHSCKRKALQIALFCAVTMRAEHASPLKVEREELVPAGRTDA
jgi:hypothetical protein